MSEITFEQWTEYQAEKAEHERQEMARFFDEFWRPIVCNPDGCINQDKLNAELWDYYTFMGTAAKVYDGITGGRVSKINTLPEAILAENEDHLQRCVREALEAQVEQARGLIDSAMEMMGEGCASCNACPVGGPYDPHCPFGGWLEARSGFLQALREGGEG